MRSLITLLCLLLTVQSLPAEKLPAGLFAGLGSEDFKAREKAQSDLLSWVKKNPKARVGDLLRASSDNDDPEVRERCTEILRSLAADDYALEGEGYLGVRMDDRVMEVPGDKRQRWVVFVVEVVPGSAAAKSGLQAGDAVATLEGESWPEAWARQFSDRIRKRKPGTRVRLGVLRGGVLEDMRVELGRRPFELDAFFPEMDPEARKAMEKQAMEAHFQRWLLEKKGDR